MTPAQCEALLVNLGLIQNDRENAARRLKMLRKVIEPLHGGARVLLETIEDDVAAIERRAASVRRLVELEVFDASR